VVPELVRQCEALPLDYLRPIEKYEGSITAYEVCPGNPVAESQHSDRDALGLLDEAQDVVDRGVESEAELLTSHTRGGFRFADVSCRHG
jgi:hypothetical protein